MLTTKASLLEVFWWFHRPKTFRKVWCPLLWRDAPWTVLTNEGSLHIWFELFKENRKKETSLLFQMFSSYDPGVSRWLDLRSPFSLLCCSAPDKSAHHIRLFRLFILFSGGWEGCCFLFLFNVCFKKISKFCSRWESGDLTLQTRGSCLLPVGPPAVTKCFQVLKWRSVKIRWILVGRCCLPAADNLKDWDNSILPQIEKTNWTFFFI